jgi:nitrogen fixation/metabolism regulation signal transduction histidine kinase
MNWEFPEQHSTIKLKNMVFNSFYINVLIRVILFGLTNFGFFYLLVTKQRFFSMVLLGILVIVQIVLLIQYVNTTNRNLARFLLLLGEEDTAFTSLKEKVEKTFQGLHYSFKSLNEEISHIRLEKQYATIRFENVVNHMTAGILVWNNDGAIEVINKSGLFMLGVPGMKHMNELDKIKPGLQNKITAIKPGNRVTIRMENPWGETQNLLFRSTEFLLGKTRLNLVSFQDIRAELEEQEIESWQKLIRVLIHEVSNSVTPITTLGTNIKNRITTFSSAKNRKDDAKTNLIKDINRSAELIEQRGNGLLDFIQQYKSFIRLPEPQLKNVSVKLLLDDVCSLCSPMVRDLPITINCQSVDKNLQIRIDHKMIEQVLINLIKNAIDALNDTPDGIIDLSARTTNNLLEIDVKDNGTGIPDEIMDNVFIPFFTTKEKGSGIGLSLCRRILQMHGGTIRINSKVHQGTTISLSFPQ